jgi:hypothetical protein
MEAIHQRPYEKLSVRYGFLIEPEMGAWGQFQRSDDVGGEAAVPPIAAKFAGIRDGGKSA